MSGGGNSGFGAMRGGLEAVAGRVLGVGALVWGEGVALAMGRGWLGLCGGQGAWGFG